MVPTSNTKPAVVPLESSPCEASPAVLPPEEPVLPPPLVPTVVELVVGSNVDSPPPGGVALHPSTSHAATVIHVTRRITNPLEASSSLGRPVAPRKRSRAPAHD